MKKKIVEILSKFKEIEFAIIFGSQVKGSSNVNSDVDIAVAAQSPLGYERRVDISLALSKGLHKEIDLIDLQLASWQIMEQSLSTGVILLNKDKALYGDLIKKMLFEKADFGPLQSRTLKERRERFLNGKNGN